MELKFTVFKVRLAAVGVSKLSEGQDWAEDGPVRCSHRRAPRCVLLILSRK